MSNDSFIREVNEELRQDRVKALWTRFGVIIVGVVVLIILGTVGYVLWERHRASVAAADGDVFLAASEQAAAGESERAIAALEDLADTGVGAYPALARLRIASLRLGDGDPEGAVATFDEVAASSAPQVLRDVAAVRAAYVLVDIGSLDDVRQRVERLTNEAEPLRHSAREALGLAAWKAGDAEAAAGFFTQISEDLSAPQGTAQRARLMLELINAGVPFDPAAAGAQTGAAAAPAQPGTSVLESLENEAGAAAPAASATPATPAPAAPAAPAPEAPASAPATAPQATAPAEPSAPAPAESEAPATGSPPAAAPN